MLAQGHSTSVGGKNNEPTNQIKINKQLKKILSSNLKDRLLPYEPACPLRSGQEALLKMPSLKEVRGMACRNRAFLAVASQL